MKPKYFYNPILEKVGDMFRVKIYERKWWRINLVITEDFPSYRSALINANNFVDALNRKI